MQRFAQQSIFSPLSAMPGDDNLLQWGSCSAKIGFSPGESAPRYNALVEDVPRRG
jgi:hypothetical protein